MAETKVTSNEFNYSSVPTAVKVAFANQSGKTNTTTTTLQTRTASGLVSGWTYLVLVNIGMVAGNTSGMVILLDFGNIGMSGGRIRSGQSQATPSWSSILNVTSTSISIPFNGRCTQGGYDIEDPFVTFVPLYKT